jgi:hypothetical protein
MRFLPPGVVIATALSTVCFAQTPGPAAASKAPAKTNGPQKSIDSKKPWTPPKTAWGDPDIQGMWPGNMGVPMQRPESLGTRTTLTDQEFAQKQAQAAQQAAADSESVTASDSKPGIGPPSYWTERGTPTRQTSLIVDPPDGRLPPLTATAVKARKEARGGKGFPGEWRGEAAFREAFSARSFRWSTTTATRFCRSLDTWCSATR